MTVTAATSLTEGISTEQAREELSKFFVIADIATKAPEMFSKFIDAEWHRLMKTEDYSAFCMMAVGHQVGHVEDKGYGTPSWLQLYHERFGTLPAAWFASAEGIVDMEAYESYMDNRTLNARSNCGFSCTPTTGSPDATSLVTAWDCTPTTGDPDFTRTGPNGGDSEPPVPDEAAA